MGQRANAWGKRVAWAKQFFDMIPPHPTPSSSPEHSIDEAKSPLSLLLLSAGGDDKGNVVGGGSSSGTTSTSMTTATKGGKKAEAKRYRVLELHPLTAWKCRRCGWMEEEEKEDETIVNNYNNNKGVDGSAEALKQTRRARGVLPRHPITGRPDFTRLADHIECVTQVRGPAVAGAPPPPPPCAAGPLIYITASSSSSAPVHDRSPPTAQEEEGGGIAPSSSTALPPSVTQSDLHHFFMDLSDVEDAATTQKKQSTRLHDDATRLILLLYNPKTPRNIGSILRALGCFGYAVEEAVVDPLHVASPPSRRRPPPPRFYRCLILFTGHRLLDALRHTPLAHAGTDTQRARDGVGLYHLKDDTMLWDAIQGARRGEEEETQRTTTTTSRSRRSPGRCVHVTAVDLIEAATPLQHYSHHLVASASPPPVMVYVLGPEDGTLPDAALQRCDDAVYIPTIGSLNLSAAITVLLYDRVAKLLENKRRQRVVEDHNGDDESTSARPPPPPLPSPRGGKRGRCSEEEEAEVESRHADLAEPAAMEEASIMRHRNVNNKLKWTRR